MPDPTFFDIFGIGVFGFITIAALWALATGRPLPRRVLILLLLFGIAGLLVDGTIVYIVPPLLTFSCCSATLKPFLIPDGRPQSFD